MYKTKLLTLQSSDEWYAADSGVLSNPTINQQKTDSRSAIHIHYKEQQIERQFQFRFHTCN